MNVSIPRDCPTMNTLSSPPWRHPASKGDSSDFDALFCCLSCIVQITTISTSSAFTIKFYLFAPGFNEARTYITLSMLPYLTADIFRLPTEDE